MQACRYCGITSEDLQDIKQFVQAYKGGNPEIDKYKPSVCTSRDYYGQTCCLCGYIKNPQEPLQVHADGVQCINKLLHDIERAKVNEWLGPGIRRVAKGWGYEDIFYNSGLYCGKLLFIEAGKRISWHKHYEKDEVFWLQRGQLRVLSGDTDDINDAKDELLEVGQTFHVYRGLRHRLIALEESEVIEFSTTHYDDDSIRIEPGD